MLLPGDAGLGNFLVTFLPLASGRFLSCRQCTESCCCGRRQGFGQFIPTNASNASDVKAGIVLEAEQEAALLSELAIQSAKNNFKFFYWTRNI